MIKIELTPNYTGVQISGSQEDLEQIVDAIYELVMDELIDSPWYHTVSNTLLGLCYDIRHAAMGDRNTHIEDESLPSHVREADVLPLSYKKITYSCYCLFPEICFDMMGINSVINYRINSLTKRSYDAIRDPKVIWDQPITVMRGLQAAFISCMSKELSPGTLTRFRKYLVEGEFTITQMYHHYLDAMCLEFLSYSPKKRKSSLSVTAKHLSEFLFDERYLSMAEELERSAAEMDTTPDNLKFPENEYPEEIIW